MKLQDEYGSKGLHIFALEAQGGNKQQIVNLMTPKGVNYAVAAGVSQNYKGINVLPSCWLIGVDGKVLYAGVAAGPGAQKVEQLLHAELEKVKYPGLGMTQVDPALEAAANHFVKHEYVAARTAAQEVAASAGDNAELAQQANRIVERVNAEAQAMNRKAAGLINDKQYAAAVVAYEAIEKAFAGADEAKAAREALDAYMADETIGKEIKAELALQTLEEKAPKMSASERFAAFEAFAKEHEGTKAATRAAGLARANDPSRPSEDF